MTAKFFLALALILTLPTVSAAVIYGSVYDLSLERVDKVVLDINTSPKQVFVTKNGTYTFNVPIGDYSIKAEHYETNVLDSFAEENISLRKEGSYILDIILLPSFKEETELLQETGIGLESEKEKTYITYIVLIVSILIFLVIYVYYLKNKQIPQLAEKKRAEETKGADEPKKREQTEETRPKTVPTDIEQITKMIKEEGGRTTQKEIRKKIPLSEAKISLMIAELEDKGIIKKIKKGRGNIIILK